MKAFESLIGQHQAVELLTQAIAQRHVAPAYLFVGPDGVGRSLAARNFAELLLSHDTRGGDRDPSDEDLQRTRGLASVQKRKQLGNHPDLLWVEPTYLHQGKRISASQAAEMGIERKASPQIRLEQVREIGQFLSRPPLEAGRSVVVLDRAETMAEAAANGLLKTLEEPGRATLILIAPTTDSLLPTLVSRCAKIPFYRLSPSDMAQVLERCGCGEIGQHASVMGMAQGSPGAAIAGWEQLQAIPLELVERLETVPRSMREALELAREVDRAIDTQAQLWLLDYLQQSFWQRQGNGYLLHLLETARQNLRAYAQPRLVWEVALMEMSETANPQRVGLAR